MKKEMRVDRGSDKAKKANGEAGCKPDHLNLAFPGPEKVTISRPKRARNELQNCSKTLSEIWLVTKIDFERDFHQFPANVEGENYENTWEGCSKLSFAELSNQSSFRAYFEIISTLNSAQIRLQNRLNGD